MTQTDFIIIFLLILVGVLFIRELVRQRQERRFTAFTDPKKAAYIVDTQLKQMEFMKSLDGRLDKLGQVVALVVKILEAEHRQRQQPEKDGSDS